MCWYQDPLSFYAVYDGHGGVEAAKYSAIQLHSILGRQLQSHQPKDALHAAFEQTDRMFVDRSNREVDAAVLCWRLEFVELSAVWIFEILNRIE